MRSSLWLTVLVCCVSLAATAWELPANPAPAANPAVAATPAGPGTEPPMMTAIVSPDFFSDALHLPARPLSSYDGTPLFTNFIVATSPALTAPRPQPKVMDRKFLLMIGLGTALTVADYEMTLHCLARHTCQEANPLLPTSRAGMYATNLPLNAALYYWSYRRKASGKRLWWVAPMAIVGSHAAGVISNVPFVGK